MRGENLDLILKYCLRQDTDRITAHNIQEDLFRNFNIDEIRLLLITISNKNSKIAKVTTLSESAIIEVNGLTKSFLEKGGFKKQDDTENKEAQIKKEREQAEYENLIWSTKVSKFQAKTKLLPYIISLLSLAISICSIIFT